MKFFLFLLIIVLINSCLNLGEDSMCGNRIEKEIYNPSKTYKLIKFDRNCGATSHNTTQISIVKASDTLTNDNGNFFSAYRDSVEISWIDNTQILIRYPEQMQTFLKDTSFKQFKIRYENLIIPEEPFDINKTPDLISTDVQKIELPRGEWEWKGEKWNIQSDNKLIINNRESITKIASAIKKAKLAKNKDAHTHWLSITLYQGDNVIEIIIVKTTESDFYFDYKNDWYNGAEVAEILSYYLHSHIK